MLLDEATDLIVQITANGKILFKKHALLRIIERNISINEIIEVLNNFVIVDFYPDDRPLPSYLLLGYSKNKKPLHILLALDKDGGYIWIITAYIPDKSKWNEKLTERLKL